MYMGFALFLHGALIYTCLCTLRSVLACFWPKAKGEITYAGISEEYEADGSTFSPVIEYKYKVRGKEYHSDNFAYGFVSSGFKFVSNSIFKRYRNRPFVDVYYNPKNPKQSVLIVGVTMFHIFSISLFLALLYIFIYRANL